MTKIEVNAIIIKTVDEPLMANLAINAMPPTAVKIVSEIRITGVYFIIIMRIRLALLKLFTTRQLFQTNFDQ